MINADINDELRDKVVELALKQKHKPYVHGKEGPDSFDCAGFVKYVYLEVLGINLFINGIGKSTTTMIMTSNYGKITYFEENMPLKDISLIKKGDILFFHFKSKCDNKPTAENQYPGHCGIYLGDGMIIHCTTRNEKNMVFKTSFTKCKTLYKKLVGSMDVISYYRR